MKIAVIGLGAMGSSMAANLVRCGHSVCAFDLSAGAAARAMRNGCKIASTPAEAVQGAEAVVTMLPRGEIVQNVYFGEVFGHAPQSALLVDCSTIEVGTRDFTVLGGSLPERTVRNIGKIMGTRRDDRSADSQMTSAAGASKVCCGISSLAKV